MNRKQCRSWSDAAFCSVRSGSTLFAQAILSEYFGENIVRGSYKVAYQPVSLGFIKLINYSFGFWINKYGISEYSFFLDISNRTVVKTWQFLNGNWYTLSAKAILSKLLFLSFWKGVYCKRKELWFAPIWLVRKENYFLLDYSRTLFRSDLVCQKATGHHKRYLLCQKFTKCIKSP